MVVMACAGILFTVFVNH